MEPSIITSLYDADYNVTYDVVACRQLTPDELRKAVQQFRDEPKIMQRKTPMRNRTIRIITHIGGKDPA
jgi:hypothetical protein